MSLTVSGKQPAGVMDSVWVMPWGVTWHAQLDSASGVKLDSVLASDVQLDSVYVMLALGTELNSVSGEVS